MRAIPATLWPKRTSMRNLLTYNGFPDYVYMHMCRILAGIYSHLT